MSTNAARVVALGNLTDRSMHLAPEDAATLTQFSTHLATPQVEALAGVVAQVFDAGYRKGLDDEDDTWRQVLAHCPGLAPLLDLARDHVLGLSVSPADCSHCSPEPDPAA